MRAKRVGVVPKQVFGEKMNVIIKSSQSDVKNEIKKTGVMFDRNKDFEYIQLREGDILVVYTSSHIEF